MSFPVCLLSRSTWRLVGLGLTTTVLSLGALAIIAPSTAANTLGVVPTTLEGHSIAEKAMVFLGIRDLAAATALFWFYREGKEKEMGVLLTAWTGVCLVDTWVTTQGPRGWDKGAMVVAFGGLGLLQS
ncbi:DUF4267 domain-containing protein [Aspergillus novofumigatus IBT 16806]|uniref:Uncharacterized protein n=1 Tax=Aspergillus novofumigatus (strain IBT 16806) TaxID=1392255 RepID=A0A2I1CK12_ASPN1|nr:uncharacterized protein P174DRAFT_436369 [Aspergillus novofumigatus IBT 16806]PKX97948.1 hypothetical protein P174DRAFT_436369 [Aspergillus novofumigatus IBT 16806]